MTYSQGSPGHPPVQQPTQYGAPTTNSFPKVDSGPSKLPVYLTAAVTVLGPAVYLASILAPILTPGTAIPQVSGGSQLSVAIVFSVIAALIAALLAGAGLLPKQKGFVPVVAAISTVGFLLALTVIVTSPSGSVGWGLIVIAVFTFLQALFAVGALLLDAGVIKPPAPRPKYEQPQYGQYGAPGQYYGQQAGQQAGQQGAQPGQQPLHYGGPPHQQHAPQQHVPQQHAPQQHAPQQHAPQQQRPAYPPQYVGYPPAPAAGGYGGPQSGPPTPPTGFPSFSPPQSSSAPTVQVPVQETEATPSSSGPAPS